MSPKQGNPKNFTERHCSQAPENKAWRERRWENSNFLQRETSRMTGALSSQISGAGRRKGQHFSTERDYLSPSIIYPEGRKVSEDILRRRKVKTVCHPRVTQPPIEEWMTKPL